MTTADWVVLIADDTHLIPSDDIVLHEVSAWCPCGPLASPMTDMRGRVLGTEYTHPPLVERDWA